MSPITAGDWRERLLFWLFSIFIVGYYWCPSTRSLQSAPHDLMFYLGFLPAFVLLAPNLLWREPSRSRLLALSLTFIVYLGASALWTRGEAELSLGQVGLQTLATAAFVVGAAHLLTRVRRRQLATAVVIAAVPIAVVSVIAFSSGHRYLGGRLNSAIHFEHPNLFAHYLGFAALLGVLRILNDRRRGRNRWLPWAAATIVLVFAVFLTGGRAPLAAFLLAATAAVLLGRDRRVAVIFGVIAVLGIGWGFAVTDHSPLTLIQRGDAGRDVIYRLFIERTADHRWTGLGLGAADNMRFEKGSWEFPKGQNIRHPHSAFVATYYFGGLLGLGLLVTVLTAAAHQALTNARKRGDPTGAALLVFGVLCLLPDGHRLVSNPHLSSWLILWLPIAWIAAAGQDDPLPESPATEPADQTPPDPSPPRIGRTLFWVLAALFFTQRLFHLGPDIDTPQMWRQTDTAQYIRSFAEEGIDLLHPSVCWLADHKTTILEFPLPEAVAAVAYRVFGQHHVVARLVFLLFFLGSAIFLYRFTCELIDTNLARVTVLIYLIMPLSLYYSRAIHIDFAALFFVHGMAFLYARGLRLESARLMWTGSLFATLAMVIKAPYVLPVVPPLVYLVVRDRRWRFILRSLPALVLPAVLFGLWEVHVYRVNSQAPDWFFIPHYRKMVQNGPWYFGTMAQRLDITNWLTLGHRFWREVTGTVGLIAAAVGAVYLVRRRSFAVLAWCGGSVIMLMVFFNLSRLHNYYLIPFLAPVACLIAAGILMVAVVLSRPPLKGVFVVIVLLAALAADSTYFAETRYYRVLEDLIEFGDAIGRNTPSNSLVVVSAGDFDCRSPHLLYHAHRYGWSIARDDLTPQLLDRLVGLGADDLAIIDVKPPSGPLKAWLGAFDRRVIQPEPDGAKIYLYRFTAPE